MTLLDKMNALKEQDKQDKQDKDIKKDNGLSLDEKKDKPKAKTHKPVDMVTIPEDEFDNLNTKINIALSLPISIDDKLVEAKQNYRRKKGKQISKSQIIIDILNKHFKLE